MALTNEQITAKNFKEFYEQIRPYLNGSFPTPVANKMSKGDLYSTNERMIGQWTDGKPLYQKTINGTVPSGSANTVVTLADLSTIPYENMIIDSGYVNYGSDNKHIIPLPSGNDAEGNVWIGDNNLLRFKSSSGEHYNRPFAVTLKYTKTTDTAIKIGNETDYSEDEQIVGSWIDGRNIYQKTINFGALPNNTSKTVAHNIANIDMITDYKGICFAPSGATTQLNYVDTIYSGAGNIGCYVNKTNITVACKDDRRTYSAYVTIQYTKTTD